MRINTSTITRLALIVPALVILYFGYLYLTGSVGDPAVDFLAAGAAQEQGGQEQEKKQEGKALTAADLDERAEAIARREQELAVLERDLLRMRQEIAAERATLEAEKAEFARQEEERNGERITQIANTLKNTKSNIAANQLVALYERNRVTALYVLSRIDSRSAGKIFSKIPDAGLAARILDDLEAWRVEQAAGVDTTANN